MAAEKNDPWDARAYRSHSTGQYTWAKQLISALQLGGTESVLDIGCGDGKVTAEIARQVPKGSVVGIDSSPAMIELSSTTYPKAEYPNLGFRLLDAGVLDYEETFDIVFSNAVLHWVEDHEAVLEGIYRALKPGGKMLLQMGGEGNAVDILGVMHHFMRRQEWRDYFKDFRFPYTFHSADTYQKLLAKAGYSTSKAALIAKDMVHPDAEAFKGWIETTWFPYINRVSSEHREEFVDRFASEYLLRFPEDDKGVHVGMIRLEVEATK